MKRFFLFSLVFFSIWFLDASQPEKESFKFTDQNYQEHKNKLLYQGRGTYTAEMRFQQEMLLFSPQFTQALTEIREYVDSKKKSFVSFFFLTPSSNGELPLQRFIKQHVNVSIENKTKFKDLLLYIIASGKVDAYKLFAVAGDESDSEPLFVLLCKWFSLELIEAVVREFADQSLYGSKAVEKLLALEDVVDQKTAARILAEKLLSFSQEGWVGLDFLISLHKKLSLLRNQLTDHFTLKWFQYALAQKEISQVFIEYMQNYSQQHSLSLFSQQSAHHLNSYVRELFAVLWPYTVYVLTAQSKNTDEQIVSMLLKNKTLIKLLTDFLINFKETDQDLAKVLLQTPDSKGAPLLYQALDIGEKGLVLAVLLLGKPFIDDLINQKNYTGDTVIHLAARKGAYEFFSTLVPLLAEQKKLSLFFSLLIVPGEDGVTPLYNLLNQARFTLIAASRRSGKFAKINKNLVLNKDFLEKMAKYYGVFFKKSLETCGTLHQACFQDDSELVSFILKATESKKKGKGKLQPSSLLITYDKKGKTPAILSIEKESLCALQALLLYAYEKHMLRTMLVQRDKDCDQKIHLTTFQHALLSPETNGAYDQIMKFLHNKNLRGLFDFLLKAKASNKQTAEELAPAAKAMLLNFHKQLSWNLPTNSIKNQSSLTTFSPTTCLKEKNRDKKASSVYVSPLKKGETFAAFTKETSLVSLDLDKKFLEI